MNHSNTPPHVEINGFALREIRIRTGIDAGPCAEQAEIDRSYLNRIETGARTRVSPSVLVRLLKVLQLSDRRAILSDPHTTATDADVA